MYLEHDDEQTETLNRSDVEKTETIFVNTPVRISSQTPLEQRASYWNCLVELRHVALLKQVLEDAVVLDAGCGTGNLVKHVSKKIKTGYGIDPSVKSLLTASEKCSENRNIFFFRANGLNLPFSDNSFDVVVSSEVLEHVPDPSRYLSELFRVLKPGGYVTLSTPSAYINLFPYPWNVFKMVTSPKEYLRRICPEKNWEAALPDHPALRHSVLEKMCRDSGFSIITHETSFWYYWTPTRFFFRALLLLERMGVNVVPFFDYCMQGSEKILEKNLPVIRCLGSRQILLMRKG